MKKKLVIAIASTIAVGIVVYLVQKNKEEKRTISIADAGYETAHDILYPLKKQRWRKI